MPTTLLIASQDFSCPLISSVFPLMTLLNVVGSCNLSLHKMCIACFVDHHHSPKTVALHRSWGIPHLTCPPPLHSSIIHPFIDTQSLMNENHKQPQLGFNYYVEELFLTVCRHPLVGVLLLQLQSLFYSPDPQQLAAQPRPAQLSSPVQASHPWPETQRARIQISSCS